MKSYEEMINFVVKECKEGYTQLRYAKWPAYLLLAEAYDTTQDKVSQDIAKGIEKFEKNRKEKHKEEARLLNEARRLANLQRIGNKENIHKA